MKFRRQHRLACSLPGAVPIACVMFLLLYYLIANSALLLVEGMPLVQLPEGVGARPSGFADSVVVAMDQRHQLYFRNQKIDVPNLQSELKNLVERSGEGGLLLVLKADRKVSNQQIMTVAQAARDAGVRQTWLAARPRLFDRAPSGQ